MEIVVAHSERATGTALGRLGNPPTASAASWRAAGAAVRRLHESPVPPWPSRTLRDAEASLDDECAWLLDTAALPPDLVTGNRRIAETVFRPFTPGVRARRPPGRARVPRP